MGIEVVAFDADDTLWHSELHFVETEARFVELLRPWADAAETSARLLEMEQSNLDLFGYGMKAFTLSMVETALDLSRGEISQASISQVIGWGKEMLAHNVELIDDVADTVAAVAESHRVLLITKGDLSHQESKVTRSGLAHHFEQIQVVSEKNADTYSRIVRSLGIGPNEFLMVGNSIKSDIEPVLQIGGSAIHIEYQFTWTHESHSTPLTHERFRTAATISELVPMIADLDL